MTCASAAAAVAVASIAAHADEVILLNGDRLTGEIVSAADGELRIRTELAGEVTVDLANVRTFSTDAPIDLRLGDGTTLNQRVVAGEEPGVIRTEPIADDPAVGAQTIPLAAIAQVNPPAPTPPAWTGSLVAAGLLTRGNTDSASFSLVLDASRRGVDDRVTVGAGYHFAEQETDDGDDETTSDNWFASGKYDYFVNEKLYLFGLARVERDRIADLNLRFAPSVGVGYQWYELETFNLSTEAGLAWVYEDYEGADSENHAAGRLAYHVDKRINERVTVFHNLAYLPSLEDVSDFNINADAGIRTDFTETLFAEIKVEWRHDSTPAPDAVENDMRYVLGAGWKF